jgi:hypothetical protein
MLQKLFRKPTEIRPSFRQDATLAEELVRRVNAIDFQPSRGFLKDQWQQKRSAAAELDAEVAVHRGDDFRRRIRPHLELVKSGSAG